MSFPSSVQVELSNGCICCTLREDLLAELIKLAKEGRFEYIMIESTGISEPMQVAEVFTFADETGMQLSDVARLDTCVTVVDALNFFEDYNARDKLQDRRVAAHETDARTVVDLLTDQIEFADVLIVNKVDLLEDRPDEKARLMGVLRALNPAARILESVRGVVSLTEVMNTGLFSLEKASLAPGWLAEARGSHVPETLEYGISSFVFRADRPFHPTRLHALFVGAAAADAAAKHAL
ncbi:GTP-binding protein, partial [archaeon]